MASLDLGTLKVGVKVEGAEQAKGSLTGVERAIEQVDLEATKASGGIKMLSGSFRESLNSTKLFNGALGDGADGSSLLTGVVGGLTGSLVSMAVQGLAQAIDGLVEFSKQAVNLASDMQETKNVIDVAFGAEAQGEIQAWSNSMIMAFGMSSIEASTFASQFGLLFKDLGGDTIEMSKAFTELAGDLASLYNTDVEQAFTALRSAIAGEAEPMRQFGVFLSDATLNQYAFEKGMKQTTQQMTEQEKMMLRYNYILENTVEAQGDAINSEGTYAKTVKQTKALWEEFMVNVGELILPLVNEILKGLNGIMSFFLTDVEKANLALENESKKAQGILDNSNQSMEQSTEQHYSTIEGMAKTHSDTMTELSKSSTDAMNKELGDYEKKLKETYDETTRSGRQAIQKRLENKKQELEESYRMEEEHYRKVAELQKRLGVTNTVTSGWSGGVTNRYANGTLSAEGGWSVVGEVGRELMYTPPKTKVFSNSQTEKMLGDTTITGNNFVIQANNYQEFVDSMEQAVISGEW